MNQFKNTAILNNATFQDYIRRFEKIATSLFEWVNLPESCNARWLEYCLFYYGKASFLFDKNYGYINTQAVPSGELNLYGLPTSINCHSFTYDSIRELYTGSNKNKEDETECVLIMNNYEMVPTYDTIQLFALRLYEAERTIDTNIKSQKFPTLVLCDDKQRLTLKNLYMKYEGNEPFIFGSKNLLGNGTQMTVLKTEAPFIVDKLMEYKKQIWNEALTFLGINNIEEKKERLIADESNANNELINLNLESYLLTRKEACKQINEKYGLDIDVRVRSDLKNVIKNIMSSVSEYNNIIDEGDDINE